MRKAATHRTPRLNVLVADDNDSELQLLHEALNREGMKVHVVEVHDGLEVIDYLQGRARFSDRDTYPMPDILLLDLKMRCYSGFDVLRWLRKHPACGKIPTVILSGSGLDRDVDQAYALGANTYFEKPMSFNEFVTLIHTLLQYWARSKRPLHPVTC